LVNNHYSIPVTVLRFSCHIQICIQQNLPRLLRTKSDQTEGT